jgi:predicted RNase H-like HicB family nuclease
MHQYFAVICQDLDMDFSVTFPDLPGCVASAATLEEARTLAGEALAIRLADMQRDGDLIPEPSSLETIVDREDKRCGAAILVQEASERMKGAPPIPADPQRAPSL